MESDQSLITELLRRDSKMLEIESPHRLGGDVTDATVIFSLKTFSMVQDGCITGRTRKLSKDRQILEVEIALE